MKEVTQWFGEQGWRPQAFQKECWKAYDQGKNGMLHSPTGSGKTYALWGGIVQEAFQSKKHPNGVQALWLTPLRALAVEIQQATQRMTKDLIPELQIALRTGDTSQSERAKQKRAAESALAASLNLVHAPKPRSDGPPIAHRDVSRGAMEEVSDLGPR